MYHQTNFGKFAGLVTQYADIHGYVPMAGDHWGTMTWDAQTDWDTTTWQKHVEDAVQATVTAERAVADWQTSQ